MARNYGDELQKNIENANEELISNGSSNSMEFERISFTDEEYNYDAVAVKCSSAENSEVNDDENAAHQNAEQDDNTSVHTAVEANDHYVPTMNEIIVKWNMDVIRAKIDDDNLSVHTGVEALDSTETPFVGNMDENELELDSISRASVAETAHMCNSVHTAIEEHEDHSLDDAEQWDWIESKKSPKKVEDETKIDDDIISIHTAIEYSPHDGNVSVNTAVEASELNVAPKDLDVTQESSVDELSLTNAVDVMEDIANLSVETAVEPSHVSRPSEQAAKQQDVNNDVASARHQMARTRCACVSFRVRKQEQKKASIVQQNVSEQSSDLREIIACFALVLMVMTFVLLSVKLQKANILTGELETEINELKAALNTITAPQRPQTCIESRLFNYLGFFDGKFRICIFY